MSSSRFGPPLEENGEPDITELAETDELLDRLAGRRPHLDDLDDRLIASLAVLAADVDLEPVPTHVTRRALREQGQWRAMEAGVEIVDITHPLDAASLVAAVHRQRAVAESELVVDLDSRRVASRKSLYSVADAAVGLVDPGRTLKLRMLPAMAVAGGAVIVTMGAAAALTGGESLNPAEAISHVMNQITKTAVPVSADPSTSNPPPASPTSSSGKTRADSGGARPGRGPTAQGRSPASPAAVTRVGVPKGPGGGGVGPSAVPPGTGGSSASQAASSTATSSPGEPTAATGDLGGHGVVVSTTPAATGAPQTPVTIPPASLLGATISSAATAHSAPGAGGGKPVIPPGRLKRQTATETSISVSASSKVPPGLVK